MDLFKTLKSYSNLQTPNLDFSQICKSHPPWLDFSISTKNFAGLNCPDWLQERGCGPTNFLYIFYPRKTVFGISCYRQIDVDKIKNKTDDITRGSVQKSVCVLSRLPLYGQIQVKMCLITQAYFEEGDFSKVELINETYSNLNSCLSDDLLHTQQLYVGQS